jgi:hypothetical protein
MGITNIQYTPEELQKKKEEAERKARRGEIEPTHDFTFSLIGRFSGLHKLQILDFIFNDPTILGNLTSPSLTMCLSDLLICLTN